MIQIYLNDLLYGLSHALDYIEREIASITLHHSKRVALIAAALGRQYGFSPKKLLHLAACAALHDNALSQFQQQLLLQGKQLSPETLEPLLGEHCSIGEENVMLLPFYPAVRGVILYHHEEANGKGPFGKFPEEIPLFSRMIHIADALDVKFDLSRMTEEKYSRILAYVKEQTGQLFDPEIAELFFKAFPKQEEIQLADVQLEQSLLRELPEIRVSYSAEELIGISSIFSKIIDYKSSFTCRHSAGIAEKAGQMAAFYGWDEDTQAQLYLAGALHDIGKLMVESEILEKPGKLSEQEYQHIQNHAYGSYLVLHSIRGMEEISAWAYLHHEKLDGSGYPFGRKAEALNHKERLLACLDVYQALREERPYKPPMEHPQAMEILHNMSAMGKLDADIVDDIGSCFSVERHEWSMKTSTIT